VITRKAFDVLLIISVLASVSVVMFDSIDAVESQYDSLLYKIEWFFTILFTVLTLVIIFGSLISQLSCFTTISDCTERRINRKAGC